MYVKEALPGLSSPRFTIQMKIEPIEGRKYRSSYGRQYYECGCSKSHTGSHHENSFVHLIIDMVLAATLVLILFFGRGRE